MKQLEMLYEGKAKKVYATDVEGIYIVDYKDDATAFNGEKKGTIAGKGVINNVMSNHMFQLLEQHCPQRCGRFACKTHRFPRRHETQKHRSRTLLQGRCIGRSHD